MFGNANRRFPYYNVAFLFLSRIRLPCPNYPGSFKESCGFGREDLAAERALLCAAAGNARVGGVWNCDELSVFQKSCCGLAFST